MNENPVFFLKVNLSFAFSFRCIQKWVFVAESVGSKIIFICDDEKLKEDILNKITFVRKLDFIRSLVSELRAEIDELCAAAFSLDLKHLMLSLCHFKNDRLYFPLCTIATKKENVFVPINKSNNIKIVAGNTDRQSRIEYLCRFLLIDGMIFGLRNFGLDKTVADWNRKLFGIIEFKQRIKNIIKKTSLYKYFAIRMGGR